MGKPFEDIVLDEYRQITPDAAKQLYLTICTLNRTGTPVRAGLISRIHGISFDHFKEKFFDPLEHVVYTQKGKRGYDYEYEARHPYVAELVFDQVFVNRESLVDYFLHILSYFNLSYDSDAASYRHLISHKTMRDMFELKEHVDAIYGRAATLFPDDGHLWLHWGLYEMRHPIGGLDRAAEYLAEAEKLNAGDKFVTHAYAQLELRRAQRASGNTIREAHRKKAERLLQGDVVNQRMDDEYALSTQLRIHLERVKDGVADDALDQATLARLISDMEVLLAEGLCRFPGDSYLYAIEADLASVLSDQTSAESALRKAFNVNKRNAGAAIRLAKMLEARGEVPDAMKILEEAANVNRTDKRLNYRYAELLGKNGGSGEAIEQHLRRDLHRVTTTITRNFSTHVSCT